MNTEYWYCLNDRCGFYKKSLEKHASNPKNKVKRWIILRGKISQEDDWAKTYCPHCKWELLVNVDKTEPGFDKPQGSPLDLLRSIKGADHP
jgi:hypothetical protein